MPNYCDGETILDVPVPVAMTGNASNLGVVLGKLNNRLKVKVLPFVKNTSEYDTGFDVPSKGIVVGALVEVVTNVADATIDVGLKSTESGGDADGFLDGVSLATAGFVQPVWQGTTGAETIGVLLAGAEIKSGDASAIYFKLPKYHLTSSVTAKSVSYTTSNHTVTGNIYILYMDFDKM